MGTKVTKEEFEMLFASCGYTITDFYEGKYFYEICIKENCIEIENFKDLIIEGLELSFVQLGFNGELCISYYKL